MSARSKLQKVQNLRPEELAECLKLNGYAECCNLITAKEIDGEKFLNLSEFQLRLWKTHITLMQSSKLTAFIQHIKTNPEAFKFKEPSLKHIEPNVIFTQDRNNINQEKFRTPETPKIQIEPNITAQENIDKSINKFMPANVDVLAKALRNRLNANNSIRKKSLEHERAPEPLPTENIYGNEIEEPEILPPKPKNYQKPVLENNIPPEFNRPNTSTLYKNKNEDINKEIVTSENLYGNEIEENPPKIILPPKPEHFKPPSIPFKKPELPKNILPPKCAIPISMGAISKINNSILNLPKNNTSINERRKLPSPPIQINDDELPEYEIADEEVDYDPNGYLCPRAIQTSDSEDEENVYNEPTPEVTTRELPPPPVLKPKILSRPLPQLPQQEPEPKKFIEIFTEQKKHEQLLQQILDKKFEYDKNNTLPKAKATPEERKLSLTNKTLNINKPINIYPTPKNVPEMSSLPKPPQHLIDMIDMPIPVQKRLSFNEMPSYRNIDRKGAIMLLQDEEDGTYLLRPSSKYYCTLNVKYFMHVYNIGIKQEADGQLMGISAGYTPKFDDIEDLIDYYMNNPLKIYNSNQDFFTLKKCLPSHKY